MWSSKSLGDIVDILDKQRKPITKKNRVEGNIPYYGATGIVDWVKDYIFDEKLVLVGEDGAKWDKGDNTAFIVEGKTWVNNHAHVLRPKVDTVMHEWLTYYLTSIDLSPWVTGLTVPKLNQAQLRSIPIPLPPLAEQQRIVAKLDLAFAEIERVVHSENVSIELLERLKESNLLAQFSKLDSKCNFFRLDEVCKDFSRGKSKHRPRNDEKLYGDTVPFVQTGDVSNSTKYLNSYTKSYSDFGLQQSKKWSKGTVCITIAANIAELAILEIDACFPDSVIGALPNDDITTSEYLYYLLNFFQKKIKAKSKGSAQQNINLATFNDEKFPFPSLSVQKVIASEIAKSEASVEKIKQLKFQKIDLLNSLKSAILAQELNPSEAA